MDEMGSTMKHKDGGGLGFRQIHEFNVAQLGKQA